MRTTIKASEVKVGDVFVSGAEVLKIVWEKEILKDKMVIFIKSGLLNNLLVFSPDTELTLKRPKRYWVEVSDLVPGDIITHPVEEEDLTISEVDPDETSIRIRTKNTVPLFFSAFRSKKTLVETLPCKNQCKKRTVYDLVEGVLTAVQI